MKKRGRPTKKDTKTDQYRLRLSEEDRIMLEYLSVKYGTSMSEILRKGLRIQYNLEKFGN